MEYFILIIFCINILIVIAAVIVCIYLGISYSIWFPSIVLIIILVICGAVARPFIQNASENLKRQKQLAQTGVKTNAIIIGIEDTGLTSNDNPHLKITVEIKSGIQSTFKTKVSRFKIPRIGDTIDIIYDPSNPACSLPVSL